MSAIASAADGPREELQAYVVAAARDPTNPMPLYRIAGICRARGDLEGWRRAIKLACQRGHRTPERIYERAKAKLLLGDWSGWVDLESRRCEPGTQSRCAPQLGWTSSVWDGWSDLHGARLLIYLERGFGDSIQMLRFIPPIVQRAARVIVAVRPALQSFIEHNVGAHVEVVARSPCPSGAFDQYVWSMSLPAHCASLPDFVRLSAPRRGRVLTSGSPRLMAGICWAGNPRHADDHTRSMPFGALTPLLKRSDVVWHSLQLGERAQEGHGTGGLVSPVPALADFADTAEFIQQLDFVVSVDTAVCHLAGSLGVPTFLLLPIVGEWRWGLGARTSWYPSLRILRQDRQGDWHGVVAALGAMLDERRVEAAMSDTTAI